MTRWGVFLLILFVALGLSKKPERKAATAAVWAAAIIVTLVVANIVR